MNTVFTKNYICVLGVSASCAMGASMPIFSILFGDVTGILGYSDTQKVTHVKLNQILRRILIFYFFNHNC